MIVFHADLDNTMIYSYKHDIGQEKKCVEIYQGREISFVTDRTFCLLKRVAEQVQFVPTTTRTIEQYQRIDLGIGIPKYALVCNGGVLLVDGREEKEWYAESLSFIEDCQPVLSEAEKILAGDANRSFEVRNIKKLFIFTKSSCPENTVHILKRYCDEECVDVFSNGEKVYVVPKSLNKGMAVRRLRKRLNAEMVLAAGDSEFDLSMLDEADISFAPDSLSMEGCLPVHTNVFGRESMFSEMVLESVLQEVEART